LHTLIRKKWGSLEFTLIRNSPGEEHIKPLRKTSHGTEKIIGTFQMREHVFRSATFLSAVAERRRDGLPEYTVSNKDSFRPRLPFVKVYKG
jgi:hypothetical protein